MITIALTYLFAASFSMNMPLYADCFQPEVVENQCQNPDNEETYQADGCNVTCENQYPLLSQWAPIQDNSEDTSNESSSNQTKNTHPNKKIKSTGHSMNENLRKQIEEWHKTSCHKEIIDTLEKLPETELDFDAVGLLARAYINIGDYSNAIVRLQSVSDKGMDDALWNLRMGSAEYCLDRYRTALQYFYKAAKLDPENEDTRNLIRQCNMEIPFAKRVDDFWNWFLENETKMSDIFWPVSDTEVDKFTAFVHEGTSLISENLYFNLGGDHEFTFSVNGWPDLYLLYPYIISRMPESLKGKWKFFPFSQGADRLFNFRMYGADINTEQIMVRPFYQEDRNCFTITYHENNLNALPKEKSENVMWVILEKLLGEGIASTYIKEIAPSRSAGKDMIPLHELKKRIEESVKAGGKDFLENPKDLNTGYSMTPRESEELRFDVIVGTTCLEAAVTEYYDDSTVIFDHANSFGAQAMFIVFENYCTDGHTLLNFRHELEDRISAEILEPMNLGQVTGGANGTKCGYIDLLIFDVQAFVDMVRPLLAQYPGLSFYISDFRQHAPLFPLIEAGPTPDN